MKKAATLNKAIKGKGPLSLRRLHQAAETLHLMKANQEALDMMRPGWDAPDASLVELGTGELRLLQGMRLAQATVIALLEEIRLVAMVERMVKR